MLWTLLASALANPFVVLDGPRPEKDIGWLQLVQLEKCLERQAGTMILTVQPDGTVSSVVRHRAVGSERACLELEVKHWVLKPRLKHVEATRFIVRIDPPVGLASDGAPVAPVVVPVPRGEVRNPVEVGFREVVIMGPIDKALARKEIERFKHRIRHCYEKVPAEPPFLVASLAVELGVGEEGQVNTLMVLKSQLLDPNIQECVENRFLRMNFARKGKRMARIQVGMIFIPKD